MGHKRPFGTIVEIGDILVSEDVILEYFACDYPVCAHENERSRGTTYVHMDLAQMGVGGITSWGTWPLKEYLLPAKPYDFVFTLSPVFDDIR